MTKAFDAWSAAYNEFAKTGTELLWPSETLVRLFKGEYVPDLDRDFLGKKVVDIGFGNGNNLIFLGSLGLSLSGIEVHPEICQTVTKKLNKLGYVADLREGANRSLPFGDEEFDFLVSWNVLHYEDNETAIREAIAEYQRVLKAGGRIFLSTTGPEHKILKDNRQLGKNRFQIGRKDDFRSGEVYFYFETPENVYAYLSEQFSNVLVGRTHDFLFTETLDWFIATGVKE